MPSRQVLGQEVATEASIKVTMMIKIPFINVTAANHHINNSYFRVPPRASKKKKESHQGNGKH